MRCAALLLLALPAVAQEKELPAQVEKAVAAGVSWLKRAQEGDGSWGPCATDRTYEGRTRRTLQFRAGPTLLALYTLAVCGEKKKSLAMREGYQWLHNHYRKTQVWTQGGASTEMGTFEAAALLLALPEIHEGPDPPVRKGGKTGFKRPRGSRIPKDDWRWMHEAVVFLTEGSRDSRARFRGCQAARGGWGYGAATLRTVEEMAATHFVLLGLRSAARAGYPVPAKVWYGATAYLKEMQSFGGGFGYREPGKGTVGMTAAGIVSWLICREQLALARKRIPPPDTCSASRKRTATGPMRRASSRRTGWGPVSPCFFSRNRHRRCAPGADGGPASQTWFPWEWVDISLRVARCHARSL
ncbi:MAG: hypothetical protein ACYS6Z_08015 [Planctomycetota bacterium]|jgi:hypothetical protein